MTDISNYNEIEKVLFSKEEIKNKVKELADNITKDYSNVNEDIVLVGILKGAAIFLSDLSREINLPVKIDFMSVSSYGLNTVSDGDVRILKDLDSNVENKHIILVEDIIDTGYTLIYLIKNFESRGAKSVEIATLLSKTSRRVVDVDVKYIGYDIPDEFVVGYGIDYAEKYRNLPYIACIKDN